MIISNAYWELRNLGIDTVECVIENKDSIEDIEKNCCSINASYVVMKAPIGRMDIYALLSEYGFLFAESMIEVSFDLLRYSSSLQDPSSRIKDQISCIPITQDKITNIYTQIDKGMFNTDRIYFDPVFSKEQAANRYKGWIHDEIERGSILFSYHYKDCDIGFVCLRETEKGIYCAVLGGLYKQKRPFPFGGAIIIRLLDLVKSLGGKKVISYISTNNIPIVRLYNAYGYSIEDIYYVFVKHASSKRVFEEMHGRG